VGRPERDGRSRSGGRGVQGGWWVDGEQEFGHFLATDPESIDLNLLLSLL
jgi:hypothetical protein